MNPEERDREVKQAMGLQFLLANSKLFSFSLLFFSFTKNTDNNKAVKRISICLLKAELHFELQWPSKVLKDSKCSIFMPSREGITEYSMS